MKNELWEIIFLNPKSSFFASRHHLYCKIKKMSKKGMVFLCFA